MYELIEVDFPLWHYVARLASVFCYLMTVVSGSGPDAICAGCKIVIATVAGCSLYCSMVSA